MKKKTAEVSIDTSCPPPTFEDYHRFTRLDPQTNYKSYFVPQWFPASHMAFVVDKLGHIEDLMDKYGIKKIDDLDNKFKALEIIKEKRINLDNFLNRIKKDTNYKEYKRLSGLYKIMVFSEKELTKEEYDLLKEVLL